MHLIVEILLTLLNCAWLWLVAIYKAVVPVSLQVKKDISGWNVLITGAGSGLGRLMALRFAGLGCNLVLWDISEKGNTGTAELVKEASPGTKVKLYTVDLSNRDDIYQVAAKVKKEAGEVDILVNNAGIVTGTTFLDSPDAMNTKTMEVNCNAHFWTMKAFLPSMLTYNQGHIVTIASSAGLVGASGLADYCASKFAAVGFDESMRGEIHKMGKLGVKTTVVCPFLIDTGMFEGMKFRFPSVFKALKPEYVVDKIIDAVLTNQEFLCLPKSIYVFYILRGIFPTAVNAKLAKFMGLLDTMDDFKGRKNKTS